MATPAPGTPLPEDKGPLLLGISWMLTILSTVFIVLRFICRVCYQSRVWWDDIWMACALVLSWAMTVTWTVYSSLGGTSYHPLTADVAVSIGRLNWISQAWCIAGLMFGKLGVAMLILRLQAPAKWRTILIWTMCVILVAYDLTMITLVFTQCRPIDALWNPAVKGECWDPWVVVDNAISVSAYMAFMDLALAIIPVHMIWGLQMPFKRKVGICILLSTGIFAFAMACVKMAMLPADLDRTADFVRTTVLLFLWNACEVNVVIIAGCIPTIMPIVERLRGRAPTAGPRRRRLLFGKQVSHSGTHEPSHRPGARNHSYALHSKGMGTTSSDEQWINDDDRTNISGGLGDKNDMEMGGGIHVTRHINVVSGGEKHLPIQHP